MSDDSGPLVPDREPFVKLAIRVPNVTKLVLWRLAREDGRTLSSYVRRLLKQHVDEKETIP